MPYRALALLLAGLFSFIAAAKAEEPVLFVEQPMVLERLEQSGYDFASLFDAAHTDGLAALYSGAPAYRHIVDRLAADITDLRADIKKAGRSLKEFTAAETGRVMDMRWLKAAEARLRLVGVVNRLDRRDFHAVRGEASCGEVRLIYRLSYSFLRDGRGKVLSSRMPFNFNAVFDVLPDADSGCAGMVRRWTPEAGLHVDAAWLAEGPLDRTAWKFRQLELNAQVVRFPSGQEPEFGGQAVYILRIFGIEGAVASEIPLENTPDTDRLAVDADMKARLAAYLAQNVDAVDSGVYRIPDEFLATKVLSFSTFGNARQANHPFSPLFSAEDFKTLDFSGGRLVRSPEAMLERLDNGTCQGCHQSGATAGFHVIGLDDRHTSPLNRIEVGISPHFHAEQPRRAAYLEAVREHREPDRFRPLSMAPPAVWTGEGGMRYEEADATMPCMADGDAPRFGETWQCASDTVCTPLAGADGGRMALAQCLLPPKSDAMFSGHPCLAGSIETAQTIPFADRYSLTQFTAFAAKASASDYTCRPPRIGVPGGLAYRQCDERDRRFEGFGAGKPFPREICGLTGGKKFDLCVSTGKFDQCLSGAVQRGNRSSCSADHFCRDDDICQAFPADTPNVARVKGVGFCSPTYFMFQMRIDNHTTPWKSRSRAEYRSVEAPPEDGDPDDLW